MSSNDTSRRGGASAAKGKKKAVTPTSKKEAAPALSPAGKSTPPGFAAAASTVSPKNKATEEDASNQKRLLRHRALYIFLFYMGRPVEVTLKDQSKYAGVLDCIDPDDFTVVLKNTQRLTPGSEPFETGSTFVIQQYLLAHIATTGHPKEDNHDVSANGRSQHPAAGHTFQTDGDITNNSKAHLYGRELQTASSWLDPSLDSGDLDARGGKTSWNQFEVNSKLFGVKNTYDENLYTTKLDKSKISHEQSKAAEKLAREIESQTSQNHHVAEERGNYTHDTIDEEARYSSVVRPPKSIEKQSAMPRGANAYVPPALRKAEEAKTLAPTSPKSKPPTSSPKAAAKPPGSPKKTPAQPVADEKSNPISPKATPATPAATTDKKAATDAAASKPTPPPAAPKKGLNPNAKEFKLSASASAFVPSFAAPAPAPAVVYHQPPQHLHPQYVPHHQPPYGAPPQYVDVWGNEILYDQDGDPDNLSGPLPYLNQYGAPILMQAPPMHQHHPHMDQFQPAMVDPMYGGAGYPPVGAGQYYQPPHPHHPAQVPYGGANPGPHGGRKQPHQYAPPPPLPR